MSWLDAGALSSSCIRPGSLGTAAGGRYQRDTGTRSAVPADACALCEMLGGGWWKVGVILL